MAGPTLRVSRLLATLAGAAVLGIAALALAQAAAATAPADAAQAATDLAQQALNRGDYTAAIADAARAIALDPKSSQAHLIDEIARRRITAATLPGAATSAAATQPTLLTMPQVYSIRLAELQDTDTVLQGSIPRPVLLKFWDNVVKRQPGADISLTARDRFLNPSNFSNQVAAFRAANDRAYLNAIILRSDPANMVVFRNVVSPFVLKNCATSNCHGGNANPNAGDFHIIRPASNMPDTLLYTNFLLLTTYTKNGERMINRDTPERSLLLQYALPKATALLPHPGKVDNHPLPSSDVPEYQSLSKWIKSLTFPDPEYDLVSSTQPSPDAAAKPATRPATRPR